MLGLLTALLVAATPTSKPFALAMPGLNSVQLAEGEGELRAESLSQALAAHGVKVFSARDLRTLLGLERQKQLLGCAEDNQCMMELTAALGVDGVLVGDLGHFGEEYVLNLKVLSTTKGTVMAIFNARSTAAQLERTFENGARALLKGLEAAGPWRFSGPLEPLGVTAAASPLRIAAIAPAVVGVGALVTGLVLQLSAGTTFDQFTTAKARGDAAAATTLAENGKGLELGSAVAFIGGGVALGAAVVMFFAGAPVQPTALVTPQGASLGLVGVLP